MNFRQGAPLRGERQRAEQVALSGGRTAEDGRLHVLAAGEERLGQALQASGDPAAVPQALAQLEGAAERLKARFDPDNVFHLNQNICPATTSAGRPR